MIVTEIKTTLISIYIWYVVLALYHGQLPETSCKYMDLADCIQTSAFCQCKPSSLDSR